MLTKTNTLNVGTFFMLFANGRRHRICSNKTGIHFHLNIVMRNIFVGFSATTK